MSKRQAKNREISHVEKLRRIKSFLDMSQFSGPMNAKLKAKISRYYKVIRGGENTPTMASADKRVYRARNPENLEIMKRFARMPDGYPGIKVAFIPETGKDARIRINRKTGTATIVSGGVTRKTESFDLKAIKKAVQKSIRYKREHGLTIQDQGDEQDMDDTIFDELVRQFEAMTLGDAPGTYYQIECGEHRLGSTKDSIGAVFTRDAALDMLKFLLAKYDNAHKWMHGVTVFTFNNQQRSNSRMLKYLRGANTRKSEELLRRMEKKLKENRRMGRRVAASKTVNKKKNRNRK